ncbi:hypothetical protein O4J56_14625 [Nocardiopsis sp. RSe5-2]|uniref:Type VII secretion-associated protein n=1 Tax=Nocardiopsis endophytica TaxID=3018445 RepID=A0ABT4U4K9_9ACTN|nr:hypothetical protein [Nocardiopsis endophytica]MDA2811875.1 hypothetical protein [Nocardiopsis endophytica]
MSGTRTALQAGIGATALVGAVLAGLAVPVAAAPPALADPQPSTSAEAPPPEETPEPEPEETPEPEPEPEPVQQPQPVQPDYSMCREVKYYTVPPDETRGLFGLAEDLLGDERRSSDIEQLNSGRTQPDGWALDDSGSIRPGWHLVLPYDADGQGVQTGTDPLCIIAADQAAAQGGPPPSPPVPPSAAPIPAESPSPSASPSEGAADQPKGLRDRMGDLDPMMLAGGLGVLIVLTVVALFWKPIFTAVAWPFRKIAALPWRRPRPPRFVRTRRRRRLRDEVTDRIEADRGSSRRAGLALVELVNAPAEVPARPVAILTAGESVKAVVPANATPPVSSWTVLDATTWQYVKSKSATQAVKFNTMTQTATGLSSTLGTLVGLGLTPDEDGGEQVFVDFTWLDGLLAIAGHRLVAEDALDVVADGLRQRGLRVSEVEDGQRLRDVLPPADRTVPDTPGTGGDPITGPRDPDRRHAVLVYRPLDPDEEEAVRTLPSNTLVVALGSSRAARWQWTAGEDGYLDTGAIGLRVALRHPAAT